MILTSKQIRMLELLDKQVDSCTKCPLHSNGTAIPFWTSQSKYVIIGEAPGANEVRKQTPFVGAAGQILTESLSDLGFNSKDFLIINSVQCRPVEGHRNAKPTEGQMLNCQSYLRKYIKVIDPEKILCLGNYSKFMFDQSTTGILRQRGVFRDFEIRGGHTYPVLFTIHPAYCIYNDEDGLPMLNEDLELFKNTKVERRDKWLFTLDEFLI